MKKQIILNDSSSIKQADLQQQQLPWDMWKHSKLILLFFNSLMNVWSIVIKLGMVIQIPIGLDGFNDLMVVALIARFWFDAQILLSNAR